MNPFSYVRAREEGAAISVVSGNPQAIFLAGGTTLLDLMKDGVEAPRVVVDINGLLLNTVEMQDDGIRVGALARMSEVAQHPVITQEFPVLSEALLAGASPQLRNMATIGGNLLQRTRCGYFRDPVFPCNKRQPGTGCSALTGEHRMHAILGTSEHCIATHASDMAVALVALDASVEIRGLQGARRLPLEHFYLLPGQTPERETVLKHGELIVGVHIPFSSQARRSHYLKVRDRASYEFALVSAAVALEITDGCVRIARIALGGVATVPWRARTAEDVLRDQSLGEVLFAAAANAALSDATLRQQNAFKLELAKRALVRALTIVGERA